ncbi:MAG TPA: HAMP domain-containing sensor histidine kinase [Pseudonocardia sp.]|nr:HAMP domain-containing sensor histidine kinase [Pseudonocardia sp.]
MRRRLLVTVWVLVALVVAGLGVPLAISDARGATELQFEDRVADTVRFAALAQRPLVDATPGDLQPEVERYDQVYGVAVALLARDGRPLVTSRPGLDPSASNRVALALAGRGSERYPTILPWDTAPMLLAEPVLVGGEVRGALVTLSPTGALRLSVLIEWGVLLAVGLFALAGAAVAALPLVRWIMRPIQRLDAGLATVAAGVLSGAPARRVADGKGPPELLRLTTSFNQMAAAVTHALATQRAFVADASHQLRNPLTALQLRLGNLVGQVTPDAVEEHVAALEEVDRLGRVLDSLLSLARAERTPTEFETITLDEVIADRLEAWKVLAEDSGIVLEHTGDQGLRVAVVPGSMEVVLDAVLDNAIKFSPPDGRITVRTEAPSVREGTVRLAIRDRGPGIAPEELARATDRFWRSAGQNAASGSGLGLAIALSTARQCGGDLTLDLPEGGGLRVAVRLPAAPQEESP